MAWALMLHLGVASWWGGEFNSEDTARAEPSRSVATTPVLKVRYTVSAVPRRVHVTPHELSALRAEPASRAEPAPLVSEPRLAELTRLDRFASSESVPELAPFEPLPSTAPWEASPRRLAPAVPTALAEPLAQAEPSTLIELAHRVPEAPAQPSVDRVAKPPVELAEESPAEAPVEPVAASSSEAFSLAENRPPAYPALALRRAWEGRVLLEVSVTDVGLAGEVRVLESSGVPLLDATARKAVSAWRFEPARRAGRAIAGSTTVALRFELTERTVKTGASG